MFAINHEDRIMKNRSWQMMTVLAMPLLASSVLLLDSRAHAGKGKGPDREAAVAAAQKAVDKAKAEEAKVRALLDKAKAAFEAKNKEVQRARDEVNRLQDEVNGTKNPVTRKAKQTVLDAARRTLQGAENALYPLRAPMEQSQKELERKVQELQTVSRRLAAWTAVALAKISHAPLVQKAKADAVAMQKKELEKRQTILKQIAADLKKERDAFDAELKKQPDYAALQNELAGMAKLEKGLSQQEADSRYQAWVALGKKYNPMILKARKQAGLDDKHLDKHVADVIQKRYGKRTEVKSRGQGSYAIHALDQEEAPASTEAFSLRPAYKEAYTQPSANLLGLNFHNASRSGDFQLKSFAFIPVSAATADARLGSFITVQPGYTKLKVTAKFQAKYGLRCSGLGLIGYAYAKVGIVLTGGEKSQSHTLALGEFPYLLAGTYSIKADKEVEVTKTFPIPGSGGDYFIQGSGATEALDFGALGLAAVDLNATLNEIHVEALP